MTRRYVFFFYTDIAHVNVDKLGQITDRIFILTSERVDAIPISLVTKLQKFGKSIKWIIMESDDEDVRRTNLSFLLGKLHERVPTDIEFAILTNDQDYDSIIQFVNKSRRKCLRVEINTNSGGVADAQPQAPTRKPEKIASAQSVTQHREEPLSVRPEAATKALTELQFAYDGIASAAAKVRERMLRSGNRPAELDLLKEYIILSTPNLKPGVVDQVIDHMTETKDIKVENREVLYHF